MEAEQSLRSGAGTDSIARNRGCYHENVRYLVRAKVKPGRHEPLLEAIEDGSLGLGSVAGDEYLRNVRDARVSENEEARWVEVCYCPTPLQEERPYWEEFFELTRVQDAHDRRKCKDENGSEPWACGECDCTARLERKLAASGESFLERLRRKVAGGGPDGEELAARGPRLRCSGEDGS
jgi:hypothetical protein